MTLAQVQKIYECVDTNWDQITVDGVTGANSPIALFWPQSGSGTRAVYTDVLGFDPTQAGTAPSVCTTSTEPIRRIQRPAQSPNEENTEDGIIYQNSIGLPAADDAAGTAIAAGNVAAAAIYIYSAGKFSSEWNDPTDYNSGPRRKQLRNGTASNLVDADINGANSMGNFLAGTLSMATMQSTGARARRTWTSRPSLVRSSRTPTGAPRASTARP